MFGDTDEIALSIDDIQDGENLFNDAEMEENEESSQDSKNKPEQENIDNKKQTEITTTEEEEIQPESVSSDAENQDRNAPNPNKDKGNSPTVFSSIAKALKEDGAFPDLDDDSISKVQTAEDFRKLYDEQVQASLDAKTKRVNEALEVGVENNVVKHYEGTLEYLNSLSDSTINTDTDTAVTLRKNLIFQDLLNKGFTKERATKEVNKSFKANTDIEDAKYALQECKDFYKTKYNDIIQEAKDREIEVENKRKESVKKMSDDILTGDKLLGNLQLDKTVRQKIVDNITKPIHTDKWGNKLTAIQMYERDHNEEFIKNLGVLFTVTDGFKNLDKLINSKVNKEMKKGLAELEDTLKGNTGFDGNIRFLGNTKDSESYAGITIDV